jgi:hypothetical protein
MAQGGIDVVEPHQAHHPAAKPDAFRVSGRAIDGLRGLDKFVGPALIVLGGVRRLGRICPGRLAGLVLGPTIAALGESASDADQQCECGGCEVAQNRILKLWQQSTHKFPDLFLIAPAWDAGHELMPFK